jgi:hypothetical protein
MYGVHPAIEKLKSKIMRSKKQEYQNAGSHPCSPCTDEANHWRRFQQLSEQPVDPRVRPLFRQHGGRCLIWLVFKRELNLARTVQTRSSCRLKVFLIDAPYVAVTENGRFQSLVSRLSVLNSMIGTLVLRK